MRETKLPKKNVPAPMATADAPQLLTDLRQLIEQAREAALVAVNFGLTLMHWRIGQRIRAEVLGGQRANYGEAIVSTLSRQLSWSHFRELIYLKDPLARDFYAEMCSIERWSVRTLRERVDSASSPTAHPFRRCRSNHWGS